MIDLIIHASYQVQRPLFGLPCPFERNFARDLCQFRLHKEFKIGYRYMSTPVLDITDHVLCRVQRSSTFI